MRTLLIILFSFTCWSCQNTSGQKSPEVIPVNDLISEKGTTIETRFNVPEGFKRSEAAPGSFGHYLRTLPLKPAGSFVKFYNGLSKTRSDVYDAVVDMEISDKNLQQCADAVMRLRGEYLFASKQYDQIHFNFTNGFNVAYSEWMKGNRIVVEGNKTYWLKNRNRQIHMPISGSTWKQSLPMQALYRFQKSSKAKALKISALAMFLSWEVVRAMP